MKTWLTLLALMLAGGCAAPLPNVPPSGTPAEVAAPAMNPGDTWVYASYDGYTRIPKGTVDYRVTGVQGDTVTLQRTEESGRTWQEFVTRDGSWLERPLTNLQDLRYEPAVHALRFPLHAGKEWREYVQATDPATGRTYRVRIDGRVLGWDRVRVPAGEFDALKVERRIYAGNFDYFRTEERIRQLDWYAPAIGAVVRHEGSSEYTDTSKACRYASCNIVLNDWTVFELAKVARGKPGA